MHFDLAISFLFAASPSTVAVVVSDLFELVLFTEASRRRSATFAHREWNWNIGRQSVLVILVPLELFDISVTWKRSTVKGIERGLSSNVLWSRRTGGSSRLKFSMSRIDIDVNVDVLVYDRLATIRRKCTVGYFRRSRLLEDIVAAATDLAEAVVLTEALPLHNRRSAAGAVLVNIDITMVSRPFVVLSEAEVIKVVASTSISSSPAATAVSASQRRWRTVASSSHTLKSRTIPTFTTTTTTSSSARRCWRVVIVV